MNFKPISNKFEYLNWQEIESIAKEKRSTVIWPFGAVEQHGPHLPLATDSIFVDDIISEVFKLLPADNPLTPLHRKQGKTAIPGEKLLSSLAAVLSSDI